MRDMPSFDELVEIYNHSDADLESLRQSLISELIAEAPDHTKRRLEGLQFQIDMERRRTSNSMAACIRISEMMHESLGKLTGLLRLIPVTAMVKTSIAWFHLTRVMSSTYNRSGQPITDEFL